jgi:hypothetical protein
VQEWALASRGCFPVVPPDAPSARPEYPRYADVRGGELEHCIKWGSVKSVRRAQEKVQRSYGEDVSRLVDLCRQSIVFESPGDVAACLAAIAADSAAALVRIKNRLDPRYDAVGSAGYRDVAINLRMVGPEARGLGLDEHVCEVQLLLRTFAELKSDSGHSRYVAFRNLRGE